MDIEDLRLAVYRVFAETGRAPQAADLARMCGADVPAVTAGLAELARSRQLVLDQDGDIVMAHPFSSVPLGFSVMGARTLWWGGCAGNAVAAGRALVRRPYVPWLRAARTRTGEGVPAKRRAVRTLLGTVTG